MEVIGNLSFRFIVILLVVLTPFEVSSGSCRKAGYYNSDIMCKDYTEIPRDIPVPSNVVILSMRHDNLIHTLTEGQLSRANLVNLIYLDLKNCNIQIIEKGAFVTKHTVLEVLDLSENKIEVLDPYVFKGLTRLEYLHLDFNPLKSIEADKMFPAGLSKLEYLDLSRCHLDSLPENVFDNLNLTSLHLDNNKFKTLSWRTFHNLKMLRYVSISGNPWHCDCHIKFLIDTLREKNVVVVGTLLLTMNPLGSCATPLDDKYLAGVNLNNVSSDGLVCSPHVDKIVYRKLLIIHSPGNPGYSDYHIERTETVSLDGDVYFECTYSGYPQPEITWLKDGKEITLQGSAREYLSSEQKRDKSHPSLLKMEIVENTINTVDEFEKEKNYKFSQLLIVRKLKKEDRGRYSCVVTNGAVSDRKTVVLNYTVPSINHLESVTVIENFTTTSVESDSLGAEKAGENITTTLVEPVSLGTEIGFENFTTTSVKSDSLEAKAVSVNTLGFDWKMYWWSFPVITSVLILITILRLWLKRLRTVKWTRVQQTDTVDMENIPSRAVGANVANCDQTISSIERNVRENFRLDNQNELDILGDLLIGTDTDFILGKGNFGTVYKGRAKGNDVAIKRIFNNSPSATITSLISEFKVLSSIGKHKHVVGFIGAYTKEVSKGILYIVTELCDNGSLEKFLRMKTGVIVQPSHSYINLYSSKLISFGDLIRIALEIASGMEYISAKKVVHADLSTRNVLLDAQNVCKIGDFGLARSLYEYQAYVKTSQDPLPWKWMAYESLTKMEFTSRSDVWSFGVTLWEIFSLGKIPYAGLSWTEGFAEEIRNGLRPSIPQHASAEIYAKMSECWSLDPDNRPSFPELVIFFWNIDEMQNDQ